MRRPLRLGLALSTLSLAFTAQATAQHKGAAPAPHHNNGGGGGAPHNNGEPHYNNYNNGNMGNMGAWDMPYYMNNMPAMAHHAAHKKATTTNSATNGTAAHNTASKTNTIPKTAVKTAAKPVVKSNAVTPAATTNAFGVPTYSNGNSAIQAVNSTFPSATGIFAATPSLNFPSEVSAINSTPTLNFPNNNINFPSYVTSFSVGAGALSLGTLRSQSSAQSWGTPTMHSTLASMPLGVGGVLQTVHPSYNPTHYYKNYSYYYGSSYRNYSHTSTAQRHLQKLMYDLDSIRPNTSISPSHVNTLYHDMMTLASSPKPSSSVVQNLAVNLAGGMVRRGSQQINTRQLATDLRTVLNGGHVQQNDIYNAMMQSQSILTSGGFQPNDAQTVLGHMQNVAVNSTFVRLQGYQFR